LLALTGDLDDLGLDEVLRFLTRTRQTGCLRVAGDQRETKVWVDDGAVLAATSDTLRHASPEEVMCDVLRHEGGTFSFDPDGPPAPDGTGEDLEDLLARAHALVVEWRDLARAIPSLEHRIHLAPSIPDHDHRTVTAAQWPALVAIGRGVSISGLASVLRLSDLAVLRVAHDLVDTGLAELTAPRPPVRRPAPAAASRPRPTPSRRV